MDFDPEKVTWYPLFAVDELPPGERIFIEVGNASIVVFNIGGSYYAMADVCSHDDGPVGEGELDQCEIICPRHGARFDVRTGKALKMPAVTNVPVYPLRVIDDNIEIGLS